MANALQFSGSTTTAQIQDFLWSMYRFPYSPCNDVCAIDFYVRTTTPNQALFASTIKGTIDFGTYASLTGRVGTVIWLDQNGFVNVGGSFVSAANGNVMFPFANAGNVSVTDGNWHLVLLYDTGDGIQQFIDGVPVTMTTPSSARRRPKAAAGKDAEKKRVGDSFSGWLTFGADDFNPTPVAPPYTGLMSEIRIWSGGSPGFVLAPAYVPNIGVPVAANAPNLVAYWPFWTNQSNQLIDIVSGTVTMTLNGATIANGLPQLYDDISEVVLNAPMQAFDPFTVGTQGAAFVYILSQIRLSGYTPQSFRQAYLNASNALQFSDWSAQVAGLAYPENQQTFDESDFQSVQSTLVMELTGVAQVWGVQAVAAQSNAQLAMQFNDAAQDVYTVLYDSTQVSLNAPQTSDAGTFVDIAAALASLIPGEGTAVSAEIKIAWALYGLTQQQPQTTISFAPSLQVEATAADLISQVNQAVNGLMDQANGSLAIILQDYGMLSTVAQRVNGSQGFAYGADLAANNSTATTTLDCAYNAAVLHFAQFVLTNAYPMYIWYADEGGGIQQNVNFTNNSSMFFFSWNAGANPLVKPGQPVFYSSGGQMIVGYCQPDGAGGNPNYCSLSPTAAALIQNAASQLGNQQVTLQELYSWNWTTDVDPQSCPSSATKFDL